MVKKFSISILISGNLKKKITKITKKINRINQDKHVSIPHINILSGSYTDKSKLLKIFNQTGVNKFTRWKKGRKIELETMIFSKDSKMSNNIWGNGELRYIIEK